MRQAVGIVILVLAATASGAAVPGLSRTTVKPVENFARCFSQTQDRASMPWWFVPKADGGGTFSNAGAQGVQQPYFLDIADKGQRREIRLSAASGALVRAVDSCA